MDPNALATDGPAASHAKSSILPVSRPGRWSAALTAVSFPTAWVLMTHAIPWPILDTALAPAILVTLLDSAAVTGLVALVRRRDRSILTWAAVLVAVPLGLFATFMLVGEAMAGV